MQTRHAPREKVPEETSHPASAPANILCGTDFTDASMQAVEVAAMFAKLVQEPLVLVHAADEPSPGTLPGDLRDSLALYARSQYHHERERLRGLQIELIEAFRAGPPDAVLLAEVAASHARLLVLASGKRPGFSRWLPGGVVERVAEAAGSPTLVVRDAAPLLRWTRGERRLRVLVGADFSAPSEAALRWAAWLRQLGPCDIVVTYLEPSFISYSAVDFYPSLLTDELVLATRRKEERLFRKRVRELLGRSRVRVRFEAGWGYSDAHIIELAAEERADLIVVGTHSRRGWQRFGHHSVSRGVLHYAPRNVACVPGHALQDPPLFSVIQNKPTNHQVHENRNSHPGRNDPQ